MAQISQPPPWRLAVGVDLARATTTAARVEATPSVLHGERGEGDEVFPRRRISTRSDATRRMKQGRPPVRIQGEFHHDSLMLDDDDGGSGRSATTPRRSADLRSAVERVEGAAPGGGHGQPPRGRARAW